jgi:hypothetical protein
MADRREGKRLESIVDTEPTFRIRRVPFIALLREAPSEDVTLCDQCRTVRRGGAHPRMVSEYHYCKGLKRLLIGLKRTQVSADEQKPLRVSD